MQEPAVPGCNLPNQESHLKICFSLAFTNLSLNKKQTNIVNKLSRTLDFLHEDGVS